MTLYSARHRRSIIMDRLPFHATIGGVADVQNDARCSNFGEPFCLAMCPRHRPDDYAENMARHATDSISRGPISPVTGERVW